MKRWCGVLSLVIFIGGSAYGIDENTGTSVAPFLKMGVSARSSGMGGVSVATGYGLDDFYSNPASLANVYSKEFLFMRHQWLEEVNFNYLAGALSIGHQGVGASINFVDTGELKRTTYSNPDGSGKFKTGGMVITTGYGKRITDEMKIGVSSKYINQKIDNKTGQGIGIDIGTLYQVKNLILGAVIQHIGISKIRFIEKEEKLPLVIKVGASYGIKNLLIGIDIAKPNDNSIKTNMGIQYQLHPVVALRAGYNSSIEEGPGITAGFGIFVRNFTFDAAYLPAGKFDSTFSLSSLIRF